MTAATARMRPVRLWPGERRRTQPAEPTRMDTEPEFDDH